MKVKKAIEFLVSLKTVRTVRLYKVIELLKHLEKFKVMWEELREYSDDPELTFKMENLKQKYSPKSTRM